MIVLAALYILFVSVRKWMAGAELENLGAGTALTAAAAAINGALGAYLVWQGRRRHSVILEANGKHVLTDCWTSIAVLVGLALVWITDWAPFDPICGILMACNILWSGGGLMKSAFIGLMDQADPFAQKTLTEILERETARHGLTYHQLRHRHLGDAHWVEVHLLFPEDRSLSAAHRTATEIERVIEGSLKPAAYVTTHLECASDHEELHPGEPIGPAGIPFGAPAPSRDAEERALAEAALIHVPTKAAEDAVDRFSWPCVIGGFLRLYGDIMPPASHESGSG